MDFFYETVKKYGLALCQNLHPSQTKKLKAALKDYRKGVEPYIPDAYVRLAYEMIVADFIYQESLKE